MGALPFNCKVHNGSPTFVSVTFTVILEHYRCKVHAFYKEKHYETYLKGLKALSSQLPL